MADALNRPLALFLQGGGALGAWQAGVLEALDAAGTRFDAVMGYSIGAVNGAAIAFDRLPQALARWRAIDGRAMRLSPRWKPEPSLFSPAPLRAFLQEAEDDLAARAALKVDFTVVTAHLRDGVPLNARFSRGGQKEWDGPLVEHVAASCSIPLIFPPVDLRYRDRWVRLRDGGIPTREPLDFGPLADCADLLILEMVRADEVGRHEVSPWRAIDQASREAGRRLVDGGIHALMERGRAPRVFRLAPSRRLTPIMLDFRAPEVRRMLALGAADARNFLAAPSAFRAL